LCDAFCQQKSDNKSAAEKQKVLDQQTAEVEDERQAAKAASKKQKKEEREERAKKWHVDQERLRKQLQAEDDEVAEAKARPVEKGGHVKKKFGKA